MVSEDVFEPLFLGFPGVSLESFVSIFGRGLTLEFRFLHFMVIVLTVFSNSLLPPVGRISVWTVFPQVCDFLSGPWSSVGLLFLFQEKIVLSLGMSQRNFSVYLSVIWSSESCVVSLFLGSLGWSGSVRGNND